MSVAHGQIPHSQETVNAPDKLFQKENRRGCGSEIFPAFACDINAACFAGKEVPPDNETEMVNCMAGSLDEIDAFRLSFGVRNETISFDRLYGAIDLRKIAQGFLTSQPKL